MQSFKEVLKTLLKYFEIFCIKFQKTKYDGLWSSITVVMHSFAIAIVE